MAEIRMPRLNSNDTTYVLVEWLVPDGALVRGGEPVAVVETSKATEELVAEVDGYLRRTAVEGREFGVGDLIGVQSDHPDGPATDAVVHSGASGPSYVLTDAARTLVATHAVGADELAGLGRRVVRGTDVEELVARRAAAPTAPVDPVDRQQAAVAAVVTEAHRDIPAAFTIMKVQVDAALTELARIRAERGVVAGLPELLVAALGRLDTECPRFYAGPAGPGKDVGVTLDVGTGLFIPVVRAPRESTVDQIAATLMELRKKAFRRAFRGEDLAGSGAIVLSLHHEPDVVLARTIVFPQHVAMLSLPGVLTELALDPPHATVVQRRYVNLGLTYDHRVANGRDAVAFLRRLKELVEAPSALTAR